MFYCRHFSSRFCYFGGKTVGSRSRVEGWSLAPKFGVHDRKPIHIHSQIESERVNSKSSISGTEQNIRVRSGGGSSRDWLNFLPNMRVHSSPLANQLKLSILALGSALKWKSGKG